MTTMLTEKPATATQRWTIDHGASTVDFAVKTFWGLLTVRGWFDRYDGYYQVGPDGTEIELTIEADSLDTDNPMRDTHLRAEDFFHVVLHPQVRFRSTRVSELGDGLLRIDGTLAVTGTTVPVQLDATLERIGDDLQIEGTTEVDQRQFVMSDEQLGMIRRPATLHVKALLRREGR